MKESEIAEMTGNNRLEILNKYRYSIVGGIVLSVLVVYAIKKFAKK